METVLEVVEGMRFDRGYLSPYFVTDPERMGASVDEPPTTEAMVAEKPEEKGGADAAAAAAAMGGGCRA